MSKTTKAVLIPSDATKPVSVVDYDQSDYTNLTALIFDGKRDGLFDRMTATDGAGQVVTFWFDDEGLFRLDNEPLPDVINMRAMQLFAHLNGVTSPNEFGVPLVGDYLITGGADEEGDSLDVPGWVQNFRYTWHVIFTVGERP